MRTIKAIIVGVACLTAGAANAQWVVHDPGNLAQGIINTAKEIVETSATAQHTLDGFRETAKIFEQGRKYYDALKAVHDVVKGGVKVKKSIEMVADISEIYVRNYQKMLGDPNYTPDELSTISFGYAKLLSESADILQDLKNVVNVTGMSLSDAERLAIIDQSYKRLLEYRNLVQYYTDNVINVAMPSTYRFMEKVIQELAAMYREAGVPLATVHLGGDEVARGVWLGSPKCQALMKEKGMTKPHDLAEHFITQMADIMQRNGLKFSGWQEVALGHTEEAHRQLRTQAAGVYCWNTVPGYDEVVYQIANNGYPVILCNVGNFYMDMAYNGHPDERGLDWGGYVDESVSFSMLPFSIYRSLRTDGAGNPVDLDAAEKGKTVLTAEGRKNILGVQGQLFAETIRSFNGVEYLLFPKIMGLAERGWNAYPAWEELRGAQEQQAFNKALALYYEKISDMEMPYWARNGINFRLPHPGLLVKDGKLYANVAIRGAEIRYTTDGSEPDAQSALWEAPVPCHAPVVKAKTFCQGKESLPITLKTE